MAAAREENAPQREDFSDLVAKKAREQKRKADSKALEKNKRQKDKVCVAALIYVYSFWCVCTHV